MTSTRLLIVALVSMAASPLPQPESAVLRPAGAIPLNVEGRIDHLSVDLEAKRLFVAALGNNTLEVVDLTAMRVGRSIRGLDEPQGIRYLPEARRVAVANGGNGAVVFFESNSFAVSRTTKLSGDADNVRYDPAAGRVYVGYASGAIAVLDAEGEVLGDIRLAGHPESFQLETTGPRIFVNVPQAAHIAVVDRNKRAVIATWPVAEARANYPMALDERHHRLLVGCRSPSRLLVYDTDTGRPVTALDIVGDTDDLFYDPATQRIYVAGGAGFITVIQQQDADHYRTIQKLATAAGARTALFVPELRRLFLAVPHRGNQRAEVRMYAADN
jgi:DNA-binding beta-propeller fold protein YncE